jgi:hypothetical protein
VVLAAGRDCVLGTDQSRYQPPNDVGRYAGCRRFLVTKFSGGDGGPYLDGTGPAKNAAARGRAWRSGYHFLGGSGSGEAQADFFVRATGGYVDFELPPTIDYEDRGGVGKLGGFITELHRLIPRRWPGPTGAPTACMIYSGAAMAGTFFAGLEIYWFWLAAYTNRLYPNPMQGVTNGCTPNVSALPAPDRYVPWPWTTWHCWQYAGGDGGAPGVGNEVNNCDQDAMTTAMFNRLTGGYVVTEEDEFEMMFKDKDDFKESVKEAVDDRVKDLEAKVDSLALLVGRAASRMFPFKLAGDGDWVLFVGVDPRTGKSSPVRAKIPDGATFAALIDAGMAFAESPDWVDNPTSHREIGGTDGKHPDWVEAIKKIPVVDWPAEWTG